MTNCYQNLLAALQGDDQTKIDEYENVVLAELRARGTLGPDEGYVEYGCVEHGVVHVYSEEAGWLEIEPTSGDVTVIGKPADAR